MHHLEVRPPIWPELDVWLWVAIIVAVWGFGSFTLR